VREKPKTFPNKLHLFSISTKNQNGTSTFLSEWNKHFSFLSSTIQLSNLKILSVMLIGINFCLLISLYMGRIVCLNLTLVKITIYNFPLLSILYHRWAEIEHMTRIKNYNIAIINFGQKMTIS